MTDINEENKDLIENKIPFGLLDEETQERMRAWPHGWKVFDHRMTGGWGDIKQITLVLGDTTCERVFRARPAPEPEPEPVEVLHEVSITVESPLWPKEMHYKLSFDENLENPTIEAIE
jgi:hypothetical protein